MIKIAAHVLFMYRLIGICHCIMFIMYTIMHMSHDITKPIEYWHPMYLLKSYIFSSKNDLRPLHLFSNVWSAGLYKTKYLN